MSHRTSTLEPQDVRIPAGRAQLEGTLSIPADAKSLIIFAHGSGSGRFSPRNRFVAERLQRSHLGTLLIDLLTSREGAEDEVTARLRFDIPLLARRVDAAIDWARASEMTQDLRIGLFGASTGAAAALIAAADRPVDVGAVVSRGGRPDLAGEALSQVRSPVLLLVGSRDAEVLRLNRQAADDLRTENEVRVIPGATRLFEEPGTLEACANAAAAWFESHLGPTAGWDVPLVD